jgi:hypothetical protein
MSWLFSQALVEAFSAATCSDGEPSAPSSLSPTPQAFSWPGKTTACSLLSRYGMTCAPLTENRGPDVLMWCLEASLARTSAPQARAVASKANAPASGEKWPESWLKFDPSMCSWKTAQLSLLGDSAPFSGTWPRSGLMRDGMCWELPTSAPAIGESESGFVPTVLTSEATGPGLHGNGSHNFRTWFRENSTERRSPLHGEIMMLWPEGWANLGMPLATDKFQQWRQQHGDY